MRISADFSVRPSRREHLLKPYQLALISLAFLAVLIMLATSPSRPEQMGEHPDRFSLQYLRLLAATRPHDSELKLRLSRALFAMNRLEEADKTLSAISTEDSKLRAAALHLGEQIHLAQAAEMARKGKVTPEVKLRMASSIEALLEQPLSIEELVRLAAESLAIGRPDIAARIYARLADADPAQRHKWLFETAKQLLASGQPAAAARVYDELAEKHPDPRQRKHYAQLALNTFLSAGPSELSVDAAKRYIAAFPADLGLLLTAARLALANNQPALASQYYEKLVQYSSDLADKHRYAQLVLRTLTASNQPAAALHAMRRFLEIFPKSNELLRQGIGLALANNELRMAQAFGTLLLQQNPHSSAIVAEQLRVELAAGDLCAALKLAMRLVQMQPRKIQPRLRLAQLATWTGNSGLALDQWVYLALHTDDPMYFERALQLAPKVYDLEALARLLRLKAQRGRLTQAELTTLVTTFEDIGEPEELVEILESYLRRETDQREAWEALAEVQERRGDREAALKLYTQISREFGSDVKEVTHRAQLLWELGEGHEAYVLLRDVFDHAGVASTKSLLTHGELASVGPQTVPSDKKEEDKQTFLKTLGELLWHTEPRPENLENYRQLWAGGAMIKESTWRYLLLAKTHSQTDEALNVATQAYMRYSDPEFLVWAMDLALGAERWTDLERLFDIASRHSEHFVSNKSYYLTLAEYASHKGDYDRALRAYLRVVALDPSSVAARAGVLWLLIDHSNDHDQQRGKRDRFALHRYLTDWRDMAQKAPALWLPFATGWALLGYSKEAESYYKREWTARPTDHLWLLGYVSTLDAISRSSDARRLRRFAIEQLQPEAQRASHRNATKAERELLGAYAGLVRDTYGAGKGSRWLSKVLRKDLDPQVQKGMAAVWRHDSEGEDSVPDAWINDSRRVTRTNPWGRFHKAPKLGQKQTMATLMDSGAAPDENAEPPPAPLRVLAADSAPGEEQIPINSLTISTEAGIQSINDLLILPASVSVLLARGTVALGGHLGVNQLFLNGNDDPQVAATEVDLKAYVMWRHRLGRLEVGIGGNLRPDANLLSGWLSESFEMGRHGTLKIGAYLNELAIDTRWLRLYGARHRVSLSWHKSFLRNGFFDVQGNVYHYHTRTNEELGAGVNAEFDVGYRILRARPQWSMRLSGSFTRNILLAGERPTFGGSSRSVQSILDVLPLEFGALGIGSRIEHRFPGVAALGTGRWRYFGDAWVGWMWPLNIIGFDVQAGVALGLPRKQEIRLSGFVANNRWLGPGVVNAGLNLGYVFR